MKISLTMTPNISVGIVTIYLPIALNQAVTSSQLLDNAPSNDVQFVALQTARRWPTPRSATSWRSSSPTWGSSATTPSSRRRRRRWRRRKWRRRWRPTRLRRRSGDRESRQLEELFTLVTSAECFQCDWNKTFSYRVLHFILFPQADTQLWTHMRAAKLWWAFFFPNPHTFIHNFCSQITWLGLPFCQQFFPYHHYVIRERETG